jgi:hypothetical protein
MPGVGSMPTVCSSRVLAVCPLWTSSHAAPGYRRSAQPQHGDGDPQTRVCQ